MYGVGLNPVYVERMEARKAKKEASGKAAAERFDEGVADKLGVLFDPSAASAASYDDEERLGDSPPSKTREQQLEDLPADYWIEVECPSYVFAGESLSTETADGDRIEVIVPEWAESGGTFWVVYLEEDGEWMPQQRAAADATGVVVPANMEEGMVVPTGGAEEALDVFAAIYQNPYDDDFGDAPNAV